MSFIALITFESALESSESILFEKSSGSKSGNLISYQEHALTDSSALYRIPLELVQNRKLHNETSFSGSSF